MHDIYSLLNKNLPTPIQKIQEQQFENHGVQLFIKRDDFIHPEISGNKWRKLKHNLLEAQRQGHDTVLTFGGAFSNHVAATAAACKLAGMNSIGIIRGKELKGSDNPTLRKASEDGMRLEFISRESYRQKTRTDFLESLHQQFGDFFMVPEGGANEWGVKGCAELMKEVKEYFDVICVACGTGTTMAGIASVAAPPQQVLGFPAMKNAAPTEKAIEEFLSGKKSACSYQFITSYHFGGYAKHTSDLIQFMGEFKMNHDLELDFIYTGKMLFGIYDLIDNGFFKRNSKILAIHTGGLQGNKSISELSH